MKSANENVKIYTYDELDKIYTNYSHNEIFNNLSDENCLEFVKVFSLIDLDKVNSIQEIHILFMHLTDHTSPIREIAALKLEDIYDDIYFDDYVKSQFLKSIIDTNPNVCRAICSVIKKSSKLQKELFPDLIKKIQILLTEIKENDDILGSFFQGALKIRKNHAKNKKLFPMYWLLEALSICSFEKNNPQVLDILKETLKFNNYTIREKATKILMLTGNMNLELLQNAKSDQNFYVKNLVYDKINNDE